MLRAHKVKLLELRFALGMGPITATTLVFSTVEGELIRPRNLTKAWSRVRNAISCRRFPSTPSGTRTPRC